MTIRNLVKTQDYYNFLIEQNITWNKVLAEVQKDVPKVLEDDSLLRLFNKSKQEYSDEAKQAKAEYEYKIEFVKQRLNVIFSEWTRTETYLYYNFESIETHDMLAGSFFEHVVNTLKKQLTYH